MLSTIREKTQGIIATVIMMLIVIPFALWGINSYFDTGEKLNVAKVNGQDISQLTYRRMLDQLRGRVDSKTFDSRQFKTTILDSLIDKTLLVREAEDNHYRVSDARLAQLIRELPYFQRDGHFDSALYEAMLRREGMSPQEFEARLREENLTGQIQNGLSNSMIVTQADIAGVTRLMRQERDVAYAVINPDTLATKDGVSRKDIEEYYSSHADMFQTPEQVRVNYVRLSAADLNKGFQPTEDDLRKAYADEASRYVIPEKRRASHVLILLPAQAAEEAAKLALMKAEEVEKLARQGADFAGLAKKHSGDDTTAAKGGDLGEVRRGMLPKELEGAIYALKPGEISKPVRSTFGYHLVKLTALTPEKRKPFAEARKELTEIVRRHKAEDKFFEVSEKFRNLVYEQPDSLAPAANALGLTVEKSDWFTRTGGPGIAANVKVAEAAFAPDVISQARNSDTIEASGDTLVAVRVTDHRPAGRKPLAEVSPQIERLLKQQQSIEKARDMGNAWVQQLRAGASLEQLAKKPGVKYQPAKAVSREQTAGVDRRIVDAAFRAPRPAADKPVYDVVEMGSQGFAVMALKQVRDPADKKVDVATQEKARRLLGARRGADYYANYRAGLRQKAEIKIYPDQF